MNQWVQFPDPNLADDYGLVCQGGELSPIFLISAYRQGLFPWFNEGDPILWWSPNPRLILYPQKFKASKSLKQLMRNKPFEVRIDTCFEQVIRACSTVPRFEQDGTWLTENMIEAYVNLHNFGIVHSFEAFLNGELVGGLYGVSLGKAFFGESMFFHHSNASKIAFYHLVAFAQQNGFHFIDAQQSTSHLKSLGAEDISREEFLNQLKHALKEPTLKGKWKID